MITIVGQGLAGTSLAWRLWQAGCRDFRLIDREQRCGSSAVAAGVMNPVTGKGWNTGWRLKDFFPEAIEFYRELESLLEISLYDPLPIRRWIADDKEAQKVAGKMQVQDVQEWIDREASKWPEYMQFQGGGRLRTKVYLDASREFFARAGCFEISEDIPSEGVVVLCRGAEGLIDPQGEGDLPHRSAKGEILTVRATSGPDVIEVKNGGWIVPDGKGVYRIGASYEWDHLDNEPTEAGRSALLSRVNGQLGEPIEVLVHEAGVRPIVRQSRPLIGPVEAGSRRYIFNALGSKGAIYAPRSASELAAHLLEGSEIDPELRYDLWKAALPVS